jgi:hypothetical protein
MRRITIFCSILAMASRRKVIGKHHFIAPDRQADPDWNWVSDRYSVNPLMPKAG